MLIDWDAPLPLPAENGCPLAAGYRNDTNLNNDGSNGNYWSSTQNNQSNAYNLNFNSSNTNPNNNNNRYYGQSVRPVTAITRTQLLADLYHAYLDARRHKRCKNYQLLFEMNLEHELVSLRDELIEHRYQPLPCSVFIIHEPKKREIFAASFRDRVVRHLYYNYTHRLFENTFIADSYSCIPKRGTHYGCNRLEHHIRSVSQNYTRPCYVLKMDIQGYFMSINRQRLLDICISSLRKMSQHKSPLTGKSWEHSIDLVFVEYLTQVIIMHDPLDHCKIICPLSEWEGLPDDKSLFHSAKGCGLPIGNLTSQLFSNIYLNEFDQYMKRKLHCRHYGRYVDDSFVVATSKTDLQFVTESASSFLLSQLGLRVHPNKIVIQDAYDGIEFLGHYILPHRRYLANKTLHRVNVGMKRLRGEKIIRPNRLLSVLNSYLGLLSHTCSHRFILEMIRINTWLFRFGIFSERMGKMNLYKDLSLFFR